MVLRQEAMTPMGSPHGENYGKTVRRSDGNKHQALISLQNMICQLMSVWKNHQCEPEKETHTACPPSHNITTELEGINQHRFFLPNPSLCTQEMTHTRNFKHKHQGVLVLDPHLALCTTSHECRWSPSASQHLSTDERVKGYPFSYPVLFTLLL